MTEQSSILERMSALADATRSRLLLILEGQELTVGELCATLQLPQSTVSRHLKVLGAGGWVESRAEGASRLYRWGESGLEPAARALWELVRGQVAVQPGSEHDRQRLASVLAQRRTRSAAFFSGAAGEWERVRRELFGAGAERLALLALLEPGWTVGDLGCGTGHVSATLARFVGRVIGVDESEPMLRVARERTADLDNVELRRGTLEALPLEDGVLDVAVLFLVLHHVAEPGRVLLEAARVLRPGGRAVLTDMLAHEREEYRSRLGHVWLGFSAEQVLEWSDAAGLERARYVPLAPDPEARGPALFTCTMTKR